MPRQWHLGPLFWQVGEILIHTIQQLPESHRKSIIDFLICYPSLTENPISLWGDSVMLVSSFGSFIAPPKTSHKQLDLLICCAYCNTYDLWCFNISRDNVIDLRYSTYGKIAGFNLSKSTGNLVFWKKTSEGLQWRTGPPSPWRLAPQLPEIFTAPICDMCIWDRIGYV